MVARGKRDWDEVMRRMESEGRRLAVAPGDSPAATPTPGRVASVGGAPPRTPPPPRPTPNQPGPQQAGGQQGGAQSQPTTPAMVQNNANTSPLTTGTVSRETQAMPKGAQGDVAGGGSGPGMAGGASGFGRGSAIDAAVAPPAQPGRGAGQTAPGTDGAPPASPPADPATGGAGGELTDDMIAAAIAGLLGGQQDTSAQQAALQDQFDAQLGQALADSRARFAAGGFGASGAAAGVEAGIRGQMARGLNQEQLAIEQAARDDYLKSLGIGLGAASQFQNDRLKRELYNQIMGLVGGDGGGDGDAGAAGDNGPGGTAGAGAAQGIGDFLYGPGDGQGGGLYLDSVDQLPEGTIKVGQTTTPGGDVWDVWQDPNSGRLWYVKAGEQKGFFEAVGDDASDAWSGAVNRFLQAAQSGQLPGQT